MSEAEDIERIEHLIRYGWADEAHSLVRLSEGQIVLLSEDMLVRFQRQVGFDTYVILETSEHATRLEDGTVIVECVGKVRV